MNEELNFTLHILHDARISYKCLLDVNLSKIKSILIELSDQRDELGAVEEVRLRYVHDCFIFTSMNHRRGT